MAALSKKLRSAYGGIMHWCPGCDEAHLIPLPRWTWDGNVEAPTVHPSVNYAGICHYVLVNGKLAFQLDCIHALKGQTVVLPDWPDSEAE